MGLFTINNKDDIKTSIFIVRLHLPSARLKWRFTASLLFQYNSHLMAFYAKQAKRVVIIANK